MLAAMAELGDTVRRLRAAAGLTQMQLAVAAGVSLSLVTAVEQGISGDPRMSTLRALAGALGVTVDELVGGPSPGSPAPKRQRRKKPD
jgi:transcriptional regulator with XRE-family HTH domain